MTINIPPKPKGEWKAELSFESKYNSAIVIKVEDVQELQQKRAK